jgi:subtilisin family serine protease
MPRESTREENPKGRGLQIKNLSLTPKRREVVPFEVLCRPKSAAPVQEMMSELTLQTLDKYTSDERTVFDVARNLQRLGFQVFMDGAAASVSAQGPYELFQKVFKTSLRKRGRTIRGAGREHYFEFFDTKEGAPQPSFQHIPGAVDVAIQRPPIYFESPLPPPVKYFHLRVPGDVAMLTQASATHRRRTPAGERATGAGVRVAMLDTGFYIHPYFTAHGYRLNPVSAADSVGPATDDANGHGTGEVANIFACAPDAEVSGVKMGNNAVLSFDRAIALTPKVISCSWGWHLPGVTTPPSALVPLRLRILSAVAAGITVVFSGGNGHISFPGMMPEVIAAGGVYADNAGNLQASDYASSFMSLIYPGRRVPDFCGLVGLSPGAHYIMLPIPKGCTIDTLLAGVPFPNKDETGPTDSWGVFSGTSAAAPQVAGIAALLLQKKPTLTPAQVKATLRAHARDVTNGRSAMGEPAGPGPDNATGTGLVDALKAWLAV